MIDKLRSVAIFAHVVDAGTFRAAAQQLGLAPSRVSETVSNLENALGVTLLYRSTRHLSLTHEGRMLYQRARTMLAAMEEGLDAINPTSTEPAGHLRVSAPAFVTQTSLMDSIANFAKAHPKIELALHFTDQRKDLIRDGIDVTIRAGWLEDSEHMARKIGTTDRLLVASPGYIAGKTLPTQAQDLETWEWISFMPRPHKYNLTSPDSEVISVSGTAQVAVNAADALYEFAARGLGLAAVPAQLAEKGIARGDLVHVLPEWTLDQLGIFAVWPDGSRRENLTLTFVRFLAKEGL
ncbi:MAG: LysR family transcriptional regulator [Pseudomonadota bacterium]